MAFDDYVTLHNLRTHIVTLYHNTMKLYTRDVISVLWSTQIRALHKNKQPTHPREVKLELYKA